MGLTSGDVEDGCATALRRLPERLLRADYILSLWPSDNRFFIPAKRSEV